jgi:hypothetical protein
VSGDRRSILLKTGREAVGILLNVWRGRRAGEEVPAGQLRLVHCLRSTGVDRTSGVDGLSTSLKKEQSVEIYNSK